MALTKSTDTWGGVAEAQLDVKTVEDVKRNQISFQSPLPGEEVPLAEATSAAIRALDERIATECGKNHLKLARLIQEIRDTEATTRREARIKQALLDHAAVRNIELQNGGKPTPLPDANVWAGRELSRRAYPQRREERIAALKRQKYRCFDEDKLTPPACEWPLSVSPRDVLLAQREIRELVAATRNWAITAELFKLEHFDRLFPDVEEKELQDQIRNAGTDEASVSELTMKLAALRSPESQDVRQRFRAELTVHTQRFTSSAKQLVEHSVHVLRQLHAEAVQQEKLWLENFCLPHEATAVSRRYLDAIRELEGQPVGNDWKWPLRWFGITDLA